MTDIDTTIVGAGPYGLTIAAHLKEAGLPYQIFGSPLESWRSFMPAGMFLKSEPFASNLWDPQRRYTLQRFSKEHGLPYQRVARPLSLARFLQYADWFRQHMVSEVRDIRVRSIRALADGFALELADGSKLTSRHVVLATGHMAFAVVPPELAQLPEPQVCHSSRMAEVASYAGRDVTIIGAGQSALESAAILHEAGARVRLLARKSQISWNDPSDLRPLLSRVIRPDAGIASGWKATAISELPRIFRWYFPAAKRHWFVSRAYGASGSYWLRERVVGKVELRKQSVVQSARLEEGRVHLQVLGADGNTEIQTDHVIAATGFKVDIDRLEYLEPGLRQKIAREGPGIPDLSSSFETSVPRLFIVGIASAPVFGPIMRFMYGAKHVAPVLTRRLRSPRRP
jgi:thioredoxin reductase